MSRGPSRKKPPSPAAHPKGAEFSEELYLRLNPDVLAAVSAGSFRSGREHYEAFGRAEGRPTALLGDSPGARVIITGDPARVTAAKRTPAGNVDHVRLSPAGGIYLIGWINDQQDRLVSVDLYFPAWSISFAAAHLARTHRPDAQARERIEPPQNWGFWGVTHAGRRLGGQMCNAVIRLQSGAELQSMVMVEEEEDDALRNIALSSMAQAEYTSNPYFAMVQGIAPAIGAQLIAFNQGLTRRACSAPYIEHFARGTAAPSASIIVCLYGRPEFLFLQQASFARQPGMAAYEFIYICNSPDCAESLLREAYIATLIYGLSLTLIILPANAGFAAANNLAASHARSNRLLFVNPDVFPHDENWAAQHSAMVADLPAAQTTLFGAPLYYDNGALMHGGMYFERDVQPCFTEGQLRETVILRVEHYGKGAPPGTQEFLRPRPVPAVSGAFISAHRPWFEMLGGFNEEYIFGHYEDADLCLKSLQAGRPAWLLGGKLWHLEGKGSHRQPQHEGASAINRWLFTKNWDALVRTQLLGPSPSHPAFAAESGA